MREIIKFLCQHKMIDVLVTTAGGVEEDFIKCLGSTVLGEFHLEGAGLRKRGLAYIERARCAIEADSAGIVSIV